MNKLKAFIIATTFVIMTFWVIKYNNKAPIKPPKVNQADSPLDLIQDDIERFKNLPSNKFSSVRDEYVKLNFQIKDLHQRKKLHPTDNVKNDEHYELLKKKLFFVYAAIFNKLAFFVFNNNIWKEEDLKYIQKELLVLSNDRWSKENPVLNQEWRTISQILKDYNDLQDFIRGGNYNYLDFSNIHTRFPYDEANRKFLLALEKKSNPGNPRLKNCTRLMNDLNNVPNMLYSSHVLFMHRKLDGSWNRYKDYTYKSIFKEFVLRPLRRDIEEFELIDYRSQNYDEDLAEFNRKLDDIVSNSMPQLKRP